MYGLAFYGRNPYGQLVTASAPPPSGYTLNADGGTFAYSGAAASTLLNRRLSANGGNFNYSGASSTLRLNRLLTANSSTFSYAGASTDLLLNRRLSADGASFAYSGAAATLTYTQITGFVLNADGGTFSTAGGEVEFIYIQNFPEANASDFTVSVIVDSYFSFESRISPTIGFSAMISSTYKFNGSLH